MRGGATLLPHSLETCARLSQILELFAEDSQLNVHAGPNLCEISRLG